MSRTANQTDWRYKDPGMNDTNPEHLKDRKRQAEYDNALEWLINNL